ncbi:MAG: hypothetical protein CVU60_04845 [Deltaproteobacteria bacterium HGW-Deltaproteobacteria-18]|nr:MAG: hypothetical protein CVU60_04845 [Deltaproteobacteria bacterium HGW-Deltaproteobacteria-18]
MFDLLIKHQQIFEHGELMLLQKVSKRHVIFNNILRSKDKDIENLHSLKFNFLQQDQKWRISVCDKKSGRIVWTLLWAIVISILIFLAILILRGHA